MTQLSISLSALRREKGITQEELAAALGVTNQAVSKWETGICCPDIQALPEIADYFHVTLDDLFGRKPAQTYETLYLELRAFFETSPREDAFSLAVSLAGLLHECAFTYGYRDSVPWDTSRIRGCDDGWGYSAKAEAEGVTVRRGGTVLLCDRRRDTPADASALRRIANNLASFTDRDALRVYFALYELGLADQKRYIPTTDIAAHAHLSEERTDAALDRLPVEADDTDAYRLSGEALAYAPVLKLLSH
ncbi:MAG: helix-turn-helix transcriptional regulator [Clostridiaceae bacterium]|nr:helix-turn-helix transcriptional regulator [Clostridiaceae bacterium]